MKKSIFILVLFFTVFSFCVWTATPSRGDSGNPDNNKSKNSNNGNNNGNKGGGGNGARNNPVLKGNTRNNNGYSNRQQGRQKLNAGQKNGNNSSRGNALGPNSKNQGSSSQNLSTEQKGRGNSGSPDLNNTGKDSRTNNGKDNRNKGNRTNRGNSGASNRKFVPEKLRNLGITKIPKPILNNKKLVTTERAHSVVTLPDKGPNGKILTANPITPHSGNTKIVQNHMTLINNNTTIINQVNNYNTTETRTNYYYWHSTGGYNYCHYYDTWGYHWYGWYVGSNCFWTRYYGNRWWWYDNTWDRWCYWNGGHWWWQNPANVELVYVYNNDQYVSATAETDTVEQPGDLTFRSQDDTRVVKILGKNRDAILYDTATPPAFKPVYLDSGVQEAKFSDTNSGKPLQIILTLKDGSFEMFDGNGNPYNSSSGQ